MNSTETIPTGKAFPFSSLFLEQHQRQGVYSLYNWYKFIDQSSDIRRVQAETVRAFHDWTEAEAPYRELGWTAEQFSLNEAHLLEVIQGVHFEFTRGTIADEEALLRHCQSVGGTLSLLFCAVMEVRDRNANPHVIALGQARQLVRMARDTGWDLQKGRLFIPDTWLQDAGLSRQEFAEFPFRRIPLTQRTIDKAEELFNFGLQGLANLPWRPALFVASQALIYRALGRKLRSAPQRFQSRKATLSLPEKLFWILRGAWLALLSR